MGHPGIIRQSSTRLRQFLKRFDDCFPQGHPRRPPGSVDDPDGVGPGVLVADDLLEVVAQPVVVPGVLAEELLQGPRRHAGVEAIGSTLFSGMSESWPET